MTDTTDLKARLRACRLEYSEGVPCGLGEPINPDGPEAADALDAKDRTIERLRDKAIALALCAGKLNVALDGELKYRTHRQAVVDAMNALSEALEGQTP